MLGSLIIEWLDNFGKYFVLHFLVFKFYKYVEGSMCIKVKIYHENHNAYNTVCRYRYYY